MIKAVLLDVDNTLLDFDEGSKYAIMQVFSEYGFEYTDDVYPTFTRINTALWHDIEKGLLTREGLYKKRWPSILGALGIGGDGVAFEQCFLAHLRESAVPVEGAMETVRYLSEKYTLCIASNAAYKQQLIRLEKSGLLGYMKHVFISEQIGAPKPSAEFFQHCMQVLSPLTKNEVIMIGDSLTADINGAVEFGIKSCFFNRTGVDTESVADYTVKRLADIKRFL